MKAKVVIGIFLTITVILFLANWYVTGKAEREIDRRIHELQVQSALPVLLTYSDVSVNPIFGDVSFT